MKQTPQTPQERLKAVLGVATNKIVARWHHARTQLGYVDPIVVVAAHDAPLGRTLIAAKLGAEALEAATGPFVFVMPREAFFALFQGAGAERDREVLGAMLDQLDAKENDLKMALLVNGASVEFRFARAPQSGPTPLDRPRPQAGQRDAEVAS